LKKILSFVFIFLLVIGLSFTQQQYGNIRGVVTDTDGIPLPGVSVSLAGDLAPEATITSINGVFRFVNLAPGTYTCRFELSGFNDFLHEEIVIRVGSNIDLKVEMAVETLNEEVTVVARTPVVDKKKTGTSTNISSEQLQEIPSARDPWVVMQSVPGVSSSSRVNVGGSESGQQTGPVARGNVGSSHQLYLDGVDITENAGSGGGSPMYYDFDTFGEMMVVTGGKDASFQTGGVAINMVTRRGTNNFEVMGRLFYSSEDLQADNATDEMKALGLSGNRIERIIDTGVQLGGPIIKDKFWFWLGYGQQDIRRVLISGNYERTRIPGVNFKANFQLSPRDRMELNIVYTRKFQPDRGASATRPHDTTLDMKAMNLPIKLENEHIFSDNFLLTAKLHWFPRWWKQEPYGGMDTVPSNDKVTGMWWDSYSSFGSDRPSYSGTVDGNLFVEEILGGNHEFKFGTEYRMTPTTSSGAYGGGALKYYWDGQPHSARIYREYRRDYEGQRFSAYVHDTFSTGNMTINLGLRYDWEKSFLKKTNIASARLAPDLIPAISVGAIDPNLIWANFSPRIGYSYDISGDGKTLIRANLARYANQLGGGMARHISPTATAYVSYYWNDLNTDDNIQLDELAGYPYDGITGYSGFDPWNPNSLTSPNMIDSKVNAPLTDEFILGIERELIKDLSLGANLILRRNHRFVWYPYIGITQEDYIGPYTGTVAYNGNSYPYKYWTLNQKRPAGTIMTNRPDYYENYSGIEIVADKKLSNRWMINASLTYQTHSQHYGDKGYNDPTNIDMLEGAPGSQYFLKWMTKLSFLFQLPYDINLSGFFVTRQGSIHEQEIQVQAPERAAAGLGSSVSLYTGKYGDNRLDTMGMLDLRLQKDFKTTKWGTISLSIDAFNITNAAPALSRYSVLNSSRSNQIQAVLNPRVFRIGLRYKF